MIFCSRTNVYACCIHCRRHVQQMRRYWPSHQSSSRSKVSSGTVHFSPSLLLDEAEFVHADENNQGFLFSVFNREWNADVVRHSFDQQPIDDNHWLCIITSGKILVDLLAVLFNHSCLLSTGDMLNDSFESNQVNVHSIASSRLIKRWRARRREEGERERERDKRGGGGECIVCHQLCCTVASSVDTRIERCWCYFFSLSLSSSSETHTHWWSLFIWFRLKDIMSLQFVSYKWSRQAERLLLKWPLGCMSSRSISSLARSL